MKWQSEWQCPNPKCGKKVWARGKPPKNPKTKHIGWAVICKACDWVMKPTGEGRKIYSLVELLGDGAWKDKNTHG